MSIIVGKTLWTSKNYTMPKETAYHSLLKGFVGGADFDLKAVDEMLAKNQGKQVNVLIDSTGGNLATGLSITSA